MSKLKNLNIENGADKLLLQYASFAKNIFGNVVGAELGIAEGGGVMEIGKIWGAEDRIFGFDTFEGLHPTELSYSKNSLEATCMQRHYDEDGIDKFSYKYQNDQLKAAGLTNVILVKGIINEDSFKKAGITKLHYCLLDMDIVNSMIMGYLLVNPVMVKGGYLCLHDVVPRNHLFGLWGLYQEILAGGGYKVVEEVHESYLVILEKL